MVTLICSYVETNHKYFFGHLQLEKSAAPEKKRKQSGASQKRK
jgi:hypothetical protein